MLIVHKDVLDTEFSQVHHALMELAALWRIAHDTDCPRVLADIARIALDGREPTPEDDQALADAIDVWLYTEELGA